LAAHARYNPFAGRVPGSSSKASPAGSGSSSASGRTGGASSGSSISSGSGARDYKSIKAAADATEDPDAYLYTAATTLAKQNLADAEGAVSDNQLRDEIDKELENLGAKYTGDQYRGDDNLASAAIGGINDGIDWLTGEFGKLTNGVWDWAAGGIGDAVDNAVTALGSDALADVDLGQNIRDIYNEDTGQMVGDALLSAGLAAIPGVGVPLSIAKSAVQNADSLRELGTGVDSVTLEKLDDAERYLGGALGIGSIALDAVPGVSALKSAKAGNELVSDYLAASADDIADVAARNFAKDMAGSVAEEGAEEAAESVAKESVGDAVKNLADMIPETASDATSEVIEKATGNAVDSSIADYAERLGLSESVVNAVKSVDDAGGTDFNQAVRNLRLLDAANDEIGKAAVGSRVGGDYAQNRVYDALQAMAKDAGTEAPTPSKRLTEQIAEALEDQGRASSFSANVDERLRSTLPDMFRNVGEAAHQLGTGHPLNAVRAATGRMPDQQLNNIVQQLGARKLGEEAAESITGQAANGKEAVKRAGSKIGMMTAQALAPWAAYVAGSASEGNSLPDAVATLLSPGEDLDDLSDGISLPESMELLGRTVNLSNPAGLASLMSRYSATGASGNGANLAAKMSNAFRAGQRAGSNVGALDDVESQDELMSRLESLKAV